MEWSNLFSSFVSSDSFLYPYSFDHLQVPASSADQLKHELLTMADTQQASLLLPPRGSDKIIACGHGNDNNSYTNSGNMGTGQEKKKKKKMTREQLRMLERSFQEEIKLDPERKVKLSKELGLQPRQIAVWFQNRRARWKNKHLEHLYETLLSEFEVVSREKQMLQEEVIKLRSILRHKRMWNASAEVPIHDETETMKNTVATGFGSAQPLTRSYGGKVLNVEDSIVCPTASPTWPLLLQ